MKTFALALGSGGARGLAHIAVIEALDEMGVKPLAIAGASVGALIGAAYAAGMSGKDIRHHVLAIAHNPRETRRRLLAARAGRLSDLLSGAFSQATQMDAEKFCAQFLPEAIPADFSALAIPLVVMATDLHRREEAALSSGPLRTALAASMAFPGLFRPVGLDGRILVDGGATNPLPSKCSALRRRNEATCPARGRACSPRSTSWARPSLPPNTSTPRPTSCCAPMSRSSARSTSTRRAPFCAPQKRSRAK
jgi:NTE family protein